MASLTPSLVTYAAAAADLAQHVSGLRSEPDLPLPSVFRVVTAALVTIALAAGTLVLLKRFLPKYLGRASETGSSIKVLARVNLSRTLQVHLVDVEANRVLIVEGRTGIELAVLPQRTATELPTRT
jgi:flagellar biogenesis protein FliO